MTIPRFAFSHAGLYVFDLKTMERFYRKVFGFAVTDRGVLRGRDIVFLSRNPREHHEIVLIAGRTGNPADTSLNQLSFRVASLADLRRMHRRVSAIDGVRDISPIDHGNAFWKLYLQSDDCKALYDRCIAAGAESITPPTRLEHWPVTAAFVRDPDGYMVEILETHGETPAVSGPGSEKW